MLPKLTEKWPGGRIYQLGQGIYRAVIGHQPATGWLKNKTTWINQNDYFSVEVDESGGITFMRDGKYCRLSPYGTTLTWATLRDGNKLVLFDLWPGADLELILLPRNLKINIVLKAMNYGLSRLFLVEGNAELAVRMWSLKGWDALNKPVPVKVYQEKGALIISGEPQGDVLFPLTLDPTVSVLTVNPAAASKEDAMAQWLGGAGDNWNTDGSGPANGGGNNYLGAGLNCRDWKGAGNLRAVQDGYVRFDISALPDAMAVTWVLNSTRLQLYNTGGAGQSAAMNIGVFLLDDDSLWTGAGAFNDTNYPVGTDLNSIARENTTYATWVVPTSPVAGYYGMGVEDLIESFIQSGHWAGGLCGFKLFVEPLVTAGVPSYTAKEDRTAELAGGFDYARYFQNAEEANPPRLIIDYLTSPVVETGETLPYSVPLLDLTTDSHKVPIFSITKKIEYRKVETMYESGIKQVAQLWSRPLRHWNLKPNAWVTSEADDYFTFFMNVGHTYFYFKDPYDYQLTNESLGTGDSTNGTDGTATFQIRKFEWAIVGNSVRKYFAVNKKRIVNGTVIVYVDGVAQGESTDYNLVYNTGIVTFTAGNVPLKGTVVRATCDYFYPVRWVQAGISRELLTLTAWGAPEGIELEEMLE